MAVCSRNSPPAARAHVCCSRVMGGNGGAPGEFMNGEGDIVDYITSLHRELKEHMHPLLGCWRMFRKAGDDDRGPETEIDFLSDTEADLCVLLSSGWFVMQMRWRQEADVLVFDVYSPG